VNEFATAYERRLKSSYVTRIFTQEDFAFVRPVVDQVAKAYASWQASLTPASLSDAQALPLRMELVSIGDRLDSAVRQARLLAEASLVPVPGAFDSTGLAAKPKRRAGRGLPFGLEDPSADSAPDSAGEDLDLDASEAPAEPPADSEPPAAPPAPEPVAEAAAPEAPSEAKTEEPKPARRGRKKAEPKPPSDETP
jgi:hypothetical protein